ncbi:hypothetical protein [Halodesulfovibrio sp.]|uniref:hypothetical protein n=1 Tax=Halodesulfovibrio sp. TaxID=1912772 RepID=UPI0025BFE202|nr:hypothetical protein [Halodesulfovibrio sp.]
MAEKITADWTLELNATCPHCKEEVDLLEDCDFWEDKPNSFAILHLKNQEVYCPECGKTFICDFDY